MDHLMSPKTTRRLKRTAQALRDSDDSLLGIIGAVVQWYADQDPNTQAQVLLHGFHPELADVSKTSQELSEEQDAQALGLPEESPSLDA